MYTHTYICIYVLRIYVCIYIYRQRDIIVFLYICVYIDA